MDYREKYNQWVNDEYFDEATRSELKAIADDDKEIQERFYKELDFGTGGLRGIMGAGTNRMNKYTVGKATQGLANYIKNKVKKQLKKVLLLLMTQEICQKNLPKQQVLLWQVMELKHIYMTH